MATLRLLAAGAGAVGAGTLTYNYLTSDNTPVSIFLNFLSNDFSSQFVGNEEP